jgi:hypothetical protein
MNITELRLGLLAHGFDPLPITNPDAPGNDAGKAPRLPKWQTIKITPDSIGDWERSRRRETNTGLRCGYLLGLDVDVRDGGLVRRLLDLASDTIGPTPLMRIGQAPKALLAYRTEMPFTKIKTPRRRTASPRWSSAWLPASSLSVSGSIPSYDNPTIGRTGHHWTWRSPICPH